MSCCGLTEIQVRRPMAGRGGRRAFVAGKKKQNTMKATVIADYQGRTLWADALRLGRMHDVEVLLDDGYLRPHRGKRDRHWHSSDRITVEHARVARPRNTHGAVECLNAREELRQLLTKEDGGSGLRRHGHHSRGVLRERAEKPPRPSPFSTASISGGPLRRAVAAGRPHTRR
jgi:hypothetical protein